MGDRIGIDETPEIAKNKILDYFFASKRTTTSSSSLSSTSARCRPTMGVPLPAPHADAAADYSSIVDAALVAQRPVDFDMFVVEATLARIFQVALPGTIGRRTRYGINLLPASLLSPHFEASAFAARVRQAGLSPRQIVVECTEQQASPTSGASRSRFEPFDASASASPSTTPAPAMPASTSSRRWSRRSSRSTARS